MRKLHILTPTGKKPYPQSVIIVQAKCKQRYLSDADAVGHMALESWYACVGTVSGTTIEWGDEGQGIIESQWWRFVAEHTSGQSVVHIVSWQAREVMAALGLWDRLADETYTLKGADPYERTEANGGKAVNHNGYIVLEGPPTIVAFARQHSGTRLLWLDPQNYGIRDLATYSDAIDLEGVNGPKLDGELWVNGSGPQIVSYAVCEWLESYYRCVVGFQLGGIEHTAASQAMQAFRHNYMRDRIEIHDSKDAIALERAALYGGRCECRYIGEVHTGPRPGTLLHDDSSLTCARYSQGPLYYMDVNSMYPSIAREKALPIKLQGLCGATNIHDALAACRACGVIAAVSVETQYPVCPLRLPDRIVYPIGRFETVLCGPELLLASALGARIKVRRMALYQRAPIYAGMVQELYRARCVYRDDGNKRMEQVVKAVLNSAFGKWAQVRRGWEDVAGVLPLRPYMQWWEIERGNGARQYRSLGWNVQRMVEKEDEGHDTFPAITAYLNSYARVRLWQLLSIAGDGNTYYYDTDSLICNQYGYEALQAAQCIHQTELGKLKVVCKPTDIRIIGRQAYELDGKLTISGARGEVRKAGDAFVEVLVCPPLGYYLCKGTPMGAKGEAPGLERRIARVRVTRGYNLGYVCDDGTVTPIRFGDGKNQ